MIHLGFSFHLLQGILLLGYIASFVCNCILLHREFAQNNSSQRDSIAQQQRRSPASSPSPSNASSSSESPRFVLLRRCLLICITIHCFVSIVNAIDPFTTLQLFPPLFSIWLYFSVSVSVYFAVDFLTAW